MLKKNRAINELIQEINKTNLIACEYFGENDCKCAIGVIMSKCGISLSPESIENIIPILDKGLDKYRKVINKKYPFIDDEVLVQIQKLNDNSSYDRKEKVINYLESLKEIIPAYTNEVNELFNEWFNSDEYKKNCITNIEHIKEILNEIFFGRVGGEDNYKLSDYDFIYSLINNPLYKNKIQFVFDGSYRNMRILINNYSINYRIFNKNLFEDYTCEEFKEYLDSCETIFIQYAGYNKKVNDLIKKYRPKY